MQEALKAFVADLKTRPECLAIAVFGSYARGQQRPDSDIDVFVVVPEGSWRDVETRDGQAFEMVYASKDEAVKYYRAHPNDAVIQWQDLKVVHDPQGIFDGIREVVEEMERQGKSRPSDQMLKYLRFDIEDKIRAIEYLITHDPTTAAYYLALLGEQLIGLYFDMHQLWTPAPKQRIPYLRAHDPDVARLFTNLFCDVPFSGRISSAKTLLTRIFDR